VAIWLLLRVVQVGKVRDSLLAGLVVIALPHVWGAPTAVPAASGVPPGLAAQFAASVIGLSFVLWAAIALALSAAVAWLGSPTPDEQAA